MNSLVRVLYSFPPPLLPPPIPMSLIVSKDRSERLPSRVTIALLKSRNRSPMISDMELQRFSCDLEGCTKSGHSRDPKMRGVLPWRAARSPGTVPGPGTADGYLRAKPPATVLKISMPPTISPRAVAVNRTRGFFSPETSYREWFELSSRCARTFEPRAKSRPQTEKKHLEASTDEPETNRASIRWRWQRPPGLERSRTRSICRMLPSCSCVSRRTLGVVAAFSRAAVGD
ncbi:hypothetical protein B0T26DRAFT_363508 [Lasiosphaeria miniovina]|uniref:Uncharacterized protein n=1 Tax=Lasiosphaeria miniovina TaxID=1954250 RepID=A0AA40ACL0_9PEZI|nr:uncharacterized protein B0T26DRAFT_363508 [Lasiosphaeria miniovina]KAK0713370.1 hypothetical protein B0T26DRAFT_363508 [Lasiosphaeria miniovina]